MGGRYLDFQFQTTDSFWVENSVFQVNATSSEVTGQSFRVSRPRKLEVKSKHKHTGTCCFQAASLTPSGVTRQGGRSPPESTCFCPVVERDVLPTRTSALTSTSHILAQVQPPLLVGQLSVQPPDLDVKALPPGGGRPPGSALTVKGNNEK